MPSKIFISYRRSDSKESANRLRGALEEMFDKDTVFMDTEDIKAGEKWEEKIKKAMQDSAVVLLVIGKNFFSYPGGDHSREIGDKNDWLSYEVDTAFSLNKTLIPVLVDEAQVPKPDQLETMPRFIRDAFQLQCASFNIGSDVDEDVKKLVSCFDLDLKFRHAIKKDRYRIDKLIGEGAIANVYMAFDITLERRWQLKR